MDSRRKVRTLPSLCVFHLCDLCDKNVILSQNSRKDLHVDLYWLFGARCMSESPTTRLSLLVRLRDAHARLAWEQFVGLYAPLVYGFARKKGLQDADAADIA